MKIWQARQRVTPLPGIGFLEKAVRTTSAYLQGPQPKSKAKARAEFAAQLSNTIPRGCWDDCADKSLKTTYDCYTAKNDPRVSGIPGPDGKPSPPFLKDGKLYCIAVPEVKVLIVPSTVLSIQKSRHL